MAKISQLPAANAPLLLTEKLLGIQAGGDVLINLSDILLQAIALPQRVITAPGPQNILPLDRIVLVRQTVGAAITLNLPQASLMNGIPIMIVDDKGDSFTNPITLAGFGGTETIIGSPTFQIKSNKASLMVRPYAAGGGWFF